jgi:hypothetical protein
MRKLISKKRSEGGWPRPEQSRKPCESYAATALAFVKLRHGLATAQQRFLETDLSLATTFADAARSRYESGDSPKGDWSKGNAQVAVRTIRHFMATTDLLDVSVIDSLARRCDELEQILVKLGRANRTPRTRI